MPRKNENARSRGSVIHDNWRMHELRAMSDMLDRKIKARSKRPDPLPCRNPEMISEQIVRDFRKNEGLEFGRSLDPKVPISKIRPLRGIRWYQKISWSVALHWMCLILAILLIIIGLLIFNSFSLHKPARFAPPFYRYPHDNVQLDLKEGNQRYE